MLKRYWIFIAALGITLAGEASAQDAVPPPADSPPIEESGSGRAGAENTNPDGPAFPIRIVDDPVEAERTRSREEEAQERERRDLAAQESMARTAEQVVLITWYQIGLAALGTIAAIVGTGGLIYSLILTSRSTDAAVRSAQAERAWVIFDYWRPHGQAAREDLNRRTHIGFQPHFVNGGRSPSLNTTIWVDAKVIDVTDPIPKFTLPPRDDVAHAPVGVGKPAVGGIASVSLPELKDVSEGRKRAILYARVDYTDVYGTRRYSETCVDITLARPYQELEQPAFSGDIFVFRAVGGQNNAT